MNRQTAEHRAQSLLKDLQEEINELKKRSTALSQLALSEDYVHFLKVWMNELANPAKHKTPFSNESTCFRKKNVY